MSLNFSFTNSSHNPDQAADTGKAKSKGGAKKLSGAQPGKALPLAGVSGGGQSIEFWVRREGEELVAEALSGDGVSYAKCSKPFGADQSVTRQVKSVLARLGAEVGEPAIDSVTGVVIDLPSEDSALLADLGFVDDADAKVTAELRKRTGVPEGVIIRKAE